MVEYTFERKKKSGNNHVSCVDCCKPRGRSELESDSDESVSSATTCFFSDGEVGALDVEACAFVGLGFLVSCWLGSVLLLLFPAFCFGL